MCERILESPARFCDVGDLACKCEATLSWRNEDAEGFLARHISEVHDASLHGLESQLHHDGLKSFLGPTSIVALMFHGTGTSGTEEYPRLRDKARSATEGEIS